MGINSPDERSLARGAILVAAAVLLAALGFGSALAGTRKAVPQETAGANATFYRDVLPILQDHCQVCHRAGGIAPTAFETYAQAHAFAGPIEAAVRNRTMPPLSLIHISEPTRP